MSNDWSLAMYFSEKHPQDAAQILENLSPEKTVEFLNTLSSELSAKLLRSMDRMVAEQSLILMSPVRASEVLNHLPSSLSAALLRRMDIEKQAAIVEGFSERIKKAVKTNLRYAENTVGSLINPYIVAIPEDIIIKDALSKIKKNKQYIKNCIYVTDRDNKFLGLLKFRDILLNDSAIQVSKVMRQKVNRIRPKTSIHTVLQLPSWKQYLTLPVVDRDGTLIGELEFEKIADSQSGIKVHHKTGPAANAGKAFFDLYTNGVRSLFNEFQSAESGTIKSPSGSAGDKTSNDP